MLSARVPAFKHRSLPGRSGAWSLKPFEFELPPGVHGLVGVNGAGKSTTLELLAGVLPGRVELMVDGLALSSDAGRGRQRHIGYMAQENGLPKTMQVSDAIAYAAWLKGLSGESLRQAVERALALTDTEKWAGSTCHTLSGGTARRVALACAVVHEPRVLFLDEPTAGLDPLQRDAFQTILGTTRFSPFVLVATHLVDDITRVADRVLVLSDGELRSTVSVEEVAGAERSVARFTSFLRRELSDA